MDALLHDLLLFSSKNLGKYPAGFSLHNSNLPNFLCSSLPSKASIDSITPVSVDKRYQENRRLHFVGCEGDCKFELKAEAKPPSHVFISIQTYFHYSSAVTFIRPSLVIFWYFQFLIPDTRFHPLCFSFFLFTPLAASSLSLSLSSLTNIPFLPHAHFLMLVSVT